MRCPTLPRDGFREVTIMPLTSFALGATVVHLMDIVATSNLAPGNSIQNASKLLGPALCDSTVMFPLVVLSGLVDYCCI